MTLHVIIHTCTYPTRLELCGWCTDTQIQSPRHLFGRFFLQNKHSLVQSVIQNASVPRTPLHVVQDTLMIRTLQCLGHLIDQDTAMFRTSYWSGCYNVIGHLIDQDTAMFRTSYWSGCYNVIGHLNDQDAAMFRTP